MRSVTYVAVDGGSSDNLEATGSKLCWDAAVANRLGREERCVLVGMHCDSGDQLIDDVGLSSPHTGDVIAMAVSGAYSFACASNFNAVRGVPVVFCEDGTAREVLRRETWDELFARDTE